MGLISTILIDHIWMFLYSGAVFVFASFAFASVFMS